MRHTVALLAMLLSFCAFADERILNFHSDVRVRSDGVIEVTETIKVRAEGQQIRRGIYRDFPVEYRDSLGNTHVITVEPITVLRNDAPEAFHTVRNKRDIRSYFGREDRLLEPGVHTYVFRYRANRLLGFFDEHDELYWNVTGNRWAFPIDKASATIKLGFDVGAEEIHVDGYTGRRGSKAQDYRVHLDEARQVHFSARSALPPSHGLTIVVGWPKGLVNEPTEMQRLKWLLSDNRDLFAAVVGLIILLAYYIPVWRTQGRDPEPGLVVTRYRPPAHFSPASLRYVQQMYYDDKTMTTGIVSLAVKGCLRIKVKDETHRVEKLQLDKNQAELAPGERELLAALFANDDVVTLKQFNHEILGAARKAHKKSLQQDYKEKYFRTNGLLNIPAIVIVLVTTVIAMTVGNGPTVLVIAVVISMYLAMIFFALIMKRPTMRGRKLLDEMLGFKDYLEVAEKDELNLRNPPEKTPQLFEKYLPFALALSVEQQWSEKFARLIAAIREPNGNAYRPSWYDGDWRSSNLSETTSGISSGLSSSVAASVTPPGSSSGGGGGSSGGGGGGGGGGGW